MAKVQKLQGHFPEDIVVHAQIVSFDDAGFSEIKDPAILDVLAQNPGFRIQLETTGDTQNGNHSTIEEAAPSEEPKKVAPPKKRPASPRTKKED